MDVKQIGNVIIMQAAVKVGGNMFLIRIDCENRQEDSSPYVISYYVIADNGGLADVTKEVTRLKIKEVEKTTNYLLHKLIARIKGDLHESEYSYSYC